MDANLKREKPADMLRVEAAYCGDEIVGLRITADDPARQLLVWADNSVMNGFRIGNEFIAGWDKKIEYRDVVIGEPEPAAPAAAITPKPDEWDVRGHLAASLTFWHRLKGEDADELVAALQSWATRTQPAGAWIERWYGSGGKDGYEGWSIVSKEGRGLVAYLGRNVESGAVTEIVMAHNATLATTTAQAAPATQQAGEVRPVTPYTCPKCHALWLHWPAEQTGFGRDTLNCRSADHCHYCEKAGVEQLQRLERIPAALHAPQPSPTAQAAPAGTTLPEGWVPLTITHEGQHPEEIAYGPQRMMDRLVKWLWICKYFDKPATPAQMPDLQPLHNLLYLAQRQNSLGAMRCAITEARLELAKVRDEQKH